MGRRGRNLAAARTDPPVAVGMSSAAALMSRARNTAARMTDSATVVPGVVTSTPIGMTPSWAFAAMAAIWRTASTG